MTDLLNCFLQLPHKQLGFWSGVRKNFEDITGNCGYPEYSWGSDDELDRQQLVFEIALPDGLYIVHRLSISSDSQRLRFITSISSNGSAPFNLVQAFNKYQAPIDEFVCTQTVTRGRSCRLQNPLNN